MLEYAKDKGISLNIQFARSYIRNISTNISASCKHLTGMEKATLDQHIATHSNIKGKALSEWAVGEGMNLNKKAASQYLATKRAGSASHAHLTDMEKTTLDQYIAAHPNIRGRTLFECADRCKIKLSEAAADSYFRLFKRRQR